MLGDRGQRAAGEERGPYTMHRTAFPNPPTVLTCPAGAEAAAGLLVAAVVIIVVGEAPVVGAGAVVAASVALALAPFIITVSGSSLRLSIIEEACRCLRTGMGQALTPPLSSEAIDLSVVCCL
jgi:hypothetical protein